MILRILLCVACLSLFNASQAEAQLFRRLLRPQPQPQAQPRFQPQPQQRYVPQTVAPQNGYQGRLTASQPSRPVYVRRPDGSVVGYAQQPTQVQRFQVQVPTQAQRVQTVRLSPAQAQAVARANVQLRPNIVASTQGQLIPVRPTAPLQRQFGNVYLRPVQPQGVAPVGISVLNQPQPQLQAQLQSRPLQIQPQAEQVADSISPATEMPEAIASSEEPTSSALVNSTATNPPSSIPVNSAATNPAPKGLSLSLGDDDLVPASAEVDVEPTPAADAILDSNGQETFSVLETIE